MIRRNTWIVLIVFLVLLAAILFWNRTKQQSAPEVLPTQVEEKLFTNQDMVVVGIRIEGPDKEEVILKLQDGMWKLVSPESEMTDTASVTNAVSQLLAARVIAKPDPSMTLVDLGISVPQYRIFLDLEGGEQIILYVGNQTPTSSGYYLLPSDTRLVSVVSKYNVDQVINFISSPPILPTPTPTVEPTLESTEILESPTQTPQP